ncbi:MAG: hypothetical protein QOH96_1123 [Blastocatellia bacterium]|nr:hypothetical protein [Blastocatellia bacterium]
MFRTIPCLARHMHSPLWVEKGSAEMAVSANGQTSILQYFLQCRFRRLKPRCQSFDTSRQDKPAEIYCLPYANFLSAPGFNRKSSPTDSNNEVPQKSKTRCIDCRHRLAWGCRSWAASNTRIRICPRQKRYYFQNVAEIQSSTAESELADTCNDGTSALSVFEGQYSRISSYYVGSHDLVSATVLFVKPRGVDDDWEKTDIWKSTTSLLSASSNDKPNDSCNATHSE